MVFFFLGIIAFIALVVWFFIWFIKKSNAKYAQLWSALTPLVNGTAKGHRMSGTYQGRTVRARLNSVSDGDNNTSYYFEVNMQSAPRGSDWKVVYGGEKFMGFGEKHWHVSTRDEAAKERLTRTGVLEEMQRWGSHPTLKFKAKSGELEYSEPVNGMFSIPAPERFQAQLELLARLAAFNEQANAA